MQYVLLCCLIFLSLGVIIWRVIHIVCLSRVHSFLLPNNVILFNELLSLVKVSYGKRKNDCFKWKGEEMYWKWPSENFLWHGAGSRVHTYVKTHWNRLLR